MNASAHTEDPRAGLVNTLDSFFGTEEIRVLAGIAGTERRSSQRDGGYPVLRVNSVLLPQLVPPLFRSRLEDLASSNYKLFQAAPSELYNRIIFCDRTSTAVYSQVSFSFLPFLIPDIVQDIFTGGRRTAGTHEAFRHKVGLKSFSFFEGAGKHDGAYVVFEERLTSESLETLLDQIVGRIPDVSISFLESSRVSRYGPTMLINASDNARNFVFPLSIYYGDPPFRK